MEEYPSEQIRTLVLVGPPGAGKTSLLEALCLRVDALQHKGRVEDGTTISDRTPEEIAHGYSIDPTTVAIAYRDTKLNLIDTPGSSEFLASTALSLEAADGALIVVDAQTASNPELLGIWSLLASSGLPRLIFVNKCDTDPSAFAKTVAVLHDTLGAHVDPLELPLPDDAGLCGVVDLLANRGYREHGAEEAEISIPPDLSAALTQARDVLLDEIVQEDDAMMERYLSGDDLDSPELLGALAKAVQGNHVTPLLCGSATADVGIHHLLDAAIELIPPPSIGVQPQPLARVISAAHDQYLGRLAVLKNLGPDLHPDLILRSLGGTDEKLHQLMVPTATELVPVTTIASGDLFVAPKLAAPVGSYLGKDNPAVHLSAQSPITPGFAVTLTTTTPQDEERVATTLHKLAADDPGVEVDREPGTHRLLVRGLGTNHLAIVLERLQRRAQVSVTQHEPLTQYRETIREVTRAEGRYKKQTGGHGQFGVATIIVEPLPRGAGFDFVDEIVGGAIPRNFIPAVEKGIIEAMEIGGVEGYPITDIRVRLVDGKYHSVDSSEMSFKMAGSLALKEALTQAGTQLLEPISHLTVTVPAHHQGDVLSYVASKRGKILHTDTGAGSSVIIEADVPTAELTSFAPDLRAMTNGLGTFLSRHQRYDTVPDNITERVRAGKLSS